MRIVAGTARGRKLVAPQGLDTRPTGDRVREAMFNTLFSLDDAVHDATVLDVFAGTGALGLEALSRGARHVTFVERDPKVLRVLDTNVAGTGTSIDAVRVVRADALTWLGALAADQHFDVALVDPPYDFEEWPRLLDAIPATIAVVETNRDLTDDLVASGVWECIRHRRYGGTVVTMVRRLPSA